MALFLGHHARQHTHRHPQAAKIIELHGALEVVKTVVAGFDRAPDGAPGVVDQVVHAAVVVLQQLGEAVAIGHVGDVYRVGDEAVAPRPGFLAGFLQLVGVAPADDGSGPGFGKFVRRRQADAGRPARDQHHFAGHRAAQGAVDMQIRVEMALPIVPQAPGIVLEVGALDTRAFEHGHRIAAVKTRRVVDESHHVRRHTEVFHHCVADPSHRGQGHQAFGDAFRDEAQQRSVDKQIHLGRVGRLAEDVEHITDAVTHRVDQVVTLLGDAGLVADHIQRVDDKIHRHDVHAAALQANRRHPGRQQLAHALDQLEEVIRAVDLVHLAGHAVTDHHGRPVHRPRHLALLAHDLFTFVLGHEIGVFGVFGLLEHVFAKHAFVQTGSGDRAHMVEMPGIDGFGQLHRVARAFDVDGDLALFVGAEVIHRCQVVEVVDLPFERLLRIGRNAEFFAGEVAMHGNRPGSTHAPELAQRGHFVVAFLADEKVHHRALALQQLFDQALANETGGAGHEIMHGVLLLSGQCCTRADRRHSCR